MCFRLSVLRSFAGPLSNTSAQVLDHARVVQVRPKGVSKGIVAERVIQELEVPLSIDQLCLPLIDRSMVLCVYVWIFLPVYLYLSIYLSTLIYLISISVCRSLDIYLFLYPPLFKRI